VLLPSDEDVSRPAHLSILNARAGTGGGEENLWIKYCPLIPAILRDAKIPFILRACMKCTRLEGSGILAPQDEGQGGAVAR
jgi:hypothetical protein